MKFEYLICPHCNSIQVTLTLCSSCGRRLTPDDWRKQQERKEAIRLMDSERDADVRKGSKTKVSAPELLLSRWGSQPVRVAKKVESEGAYPELDGSYSEDMR